MIGFVKKLFKRPFTALKKDPVRYEREKKIARSDDEGKRLSLAKSSETHQEILYYLAEKDPSDAVRQAVARNAATPVQASPVLAGDSNADVRLALAERLVRLLPDLSRDKHSQIYAFVAQSMGTLALDEVLKIRKALSTALKDSEYTPPKVASQLARDIEREVAEPILLFCTALSDKDLLEIIKDHPESWSVKAIAGRKKVSGIISRAIVETNNRPAGKTLIENKGAEISQELLEDIIDRARDFPEWHGAIAMRKSLSPKMAKKLARFADKSVRKMLVEREDLDPEAIEEISDIFKRRLDFAGDDGPSNEDPMKKAIRLEKTGGLNADIVSDALAMRDRDFLYAALARMANTTVPMVAKIIDMKAPRPVVALSWRAGLPMRLALKLQQELAHVPHNELIYPKEGTDYPMDEDEMKWQLEFLGVKAA